MVAAVLLGPIFAVAITLWHQGRRETRERKLTLLRHLLAFRQLPADANFSHAINMIPFEFADHQNVVTAHSEFIQAAYAKGENDEDQNQARAIKQTRLIYEMAHALGFKIRETDLQTEGYLASGFVERDLLVLDGHKAWRDIANILWMQTRLAAGEDWNDIITPSDPEVPEAKRVEKKKK